jgi:phage baseplate assembly protein W
MADLGTDIDCLEDFKARMPLVEGRLCLAQAIARRLMTPSGRFPFWPDYGTDVRRFLLAKAQSTTIASAVQAECLKDERVVFADVTVVLVQTTLTLTIELTADDDAESFEFVFTVTADKASLLLAA